MKNVRNGLVAPICIFLVLLLSTGTGQSSQLYINELFYGNTNPQVPKEGPIVRVVPPKVPQTIPDEDGTEQDDTDNVEGVEEGAEDEGMEQNEQHAQEHPEGQMTMDTEVQDTPAPKPFRKVALTFDDGPDSNNTPKILEILKAEGVLATFFVIGEYVERHPDVLKRIFNEGHLIANHSRTHNDLALLTNEEIIALELGPTSKTIENLTGWYPMIMRPPYGSLRQDSVSFLRENGWRIVRWSLDTFDWDSTRNQPDQIMNRIQTQHHNGAIVLMHCNGPATTAVLPDVIRLFRELGYEFVTVSQL